MKSYERFKAKYAMPVMKYKPEYCQRMIELMKRGYSNLELAAEFNISEACFYNWRDGGDHPEFKEAYDIGYPLCFSWWMTTGRKKFLADKNDKGYGYWKTCMANMFSYGVEEKEKANKTVNNIAVNNLLITANTSDSELLDILNQKLQKVGLLQHTSSEEDIIDVDSSKSSE